MQSSQWGLGFVILVCALYAVDASAQVDTGPAQILEGTAGEGVAEPCGNRDEFSYQVCLSRVTSQKGDWQATREHLQAALAIREAAGVRLALAEAAHKLELCATAMHEVLAAREASRGKSQLISRVFDQALKCVGIYDLVLQPAHAEVKFRGGGDEGAYCLSEKERLVLDPGDHEMVVPSEGNVPATHVLVLDPGDHEMVVSAEGYVPATHVLVGEKGIRKTLQVELVPLENDGDGVASGESPSLEVPVEELRAPVRPPWFAPVVGTLVAGGVLGSAAGMLGGFALKEHNRIESVCMNACPPGDERRDTTREDALQTSAWILGGAAIIPPLTYLFTHLWRKRAGHDAAVRRVTVEPAGAGLSMRARF